MREPLPTPLILYLPIDIIIEIINKAAGSIY